ncbi:MAG: hypothetical protein K1X51_03005 [Rhodospirillaceae bacterium]|nr:hypothetical protein [Rhodospirillaceae bacterium]
MPLRIRFSHPKSLVAAEAPLGGTNQDRKSATHRLLLSGSPNEAATNLVHENAPTGSVAPSSTVHVGGLRRRWPSQPFVPQPFSQVEIEMRVNISMPNPVPILDNEIALLGPGLSEFLSNDTAIDNDGRAAL